MVQSATRGEKPAHQIMLDELFEPRQSEILLFRQKKCRVEGVSTTSCNQLEIVIVSH